MSSTLRWLHRLKFWNTIARRVRRPCSWALSAERTPARLCWMRMVWPSRVMLPWSGCSRKLMQRSMVLLPEPLVPIRLITSPLRASSDTPLSTSWSP
ncbi:hypothetical protein D9M71_689850 [compost metagenome]